MMCTTVLLINLSTQSWNTSDMLNKAIAQKRCSVLYKKEAPCLKKFIKVEPLMYRAICGTI